MLAAKPKNGVEYAASIKPTCTIRPVSGWAAIGVAEVWRFRDLLWTLALRDIKLRYRQTALGVVWVVAQPLLAAGIFAFVFGRVAHLSGQGVPYFLFAYAGLLGWNVFQSILTRASGCLVQNAPLVAKVYFPRLILPLSTVFASLLDFGVACVLLLILLPFAGVWPGTGLLLLPLWLLFVTLLALGGGLIGAALMVRYRDVQYVLPVAMQLAMYASPVAYALGAVPAPLRPWAMLNPLAPPLEAFRWSLLGGRGSLSVGGMAWAGACSLLLFVVGALVFVRAERSFADVI